MSGWDVSSIKTPRNGHGGIIRMGCYRSAYQTQTDIGSMHNEKLSAASSLRGIVVIM